MTLRDWAANGWLKAHLPSREEITTLLIAADNDLRDATTPDLSPAWSFNIAYNAALHLCTAALAAAGYRAHRDNKHFRSIAALMFTLGAGSEELINFLDHCRTMRHDATYEGVRRISRGEADELIEAVRELRERFGEWIRQAHPELM